MPGQVGNKGGRRKSAYEEHRDAAWLNGQWIGPVERAELEAKIKSGSYGIRDMWLWKALTGQSEAILKQAADKLLPNLVDVTSGGEVISDVLKSVMEYASVRGGQKEISADTGGA